MIGKNIIQEQEEIGSLPDDFLAEQLRLPPQNSQINQMLAAIELAKRRRVRSDGQQFNPQQSSIAERLAGPRQPHPQQTRIPNQVRGFAGGGLLSLPKDPTRPKISGVEEESPLIDEIRNRLSELRAMAGDKYDQLDSYLDNLREDTTVSVDAFGEGERARREILAGLPEAGRQIAGGFRDAGNFVGGLASNAGSFLSERIAEAQRYGSGQDIASLNDPYNTTTAQRGTANPVVHQDAFLGTPESGGPNPQPTSEQPTNEQQPDSAQRASAGSVNPRSMKDILEDMGLVGGGTTEEIEEGPAQGRSERMRRAVMLGLMAKGFADNPLFTSGFADGAAAASQAGLATDQQSIENEMAQRQMAQRQAIADQTNQARLGAAGLDFESRRMASEGDLREAAIRASSAQDISNRDAQQRRIEMAIKRSAEITDNLLGEASTESDVLNLLIQTSNAAGKPMTESQARDIMIRGLQSTVLQRNILDRLAIDFNVPFHERVNSVHAGGVEVPGSNPTEGTILDR